MYFILFLFVIPSSPHPSIPTSPAIQVARLLESIIAAFWRKGPHSYTLHRPSTVTHTTTGNWELLTTAQSVEGSWRTWKEPGKLHTERPMARESNLQPMWLWFFCVNNFNELLNISAVCPRRGLQTAAEPDGSNGPWRRPPHKRPPLNWCIVFQAITHYHSDSFCWSRSQRIRHGGLEVTQSAELLFQAFMMFTWSPVRNWLRRGTKNSKTNAKNLSLLFFRYFHVNSLVAQMYGSPQASSYLPDRKNNSGGAKEKSAWCPESMQFVTSWNLHAGEYWFPIDAHFCCTDFLLFPDANCISLITVLSSLFFSNSRVLHKNSWGQWLQITNTQRAVLPPAVEAANLLILNFELLDGITGDGTNQKVNEWNIMAISTSFFF